MPYLRKHGDRNKFDFVPNNTYTRKYYLDILDEIKDDEIVPLVMGVGQLKEGQNFDGKFFALKEKHYPMLI